MSQTVTPTIAYFITHWKASNAYKRANYQPFLIKLLGMGKRKKGELHFQAKTENKENK